MTTWTAPSAHRENEPFAGPERPMLQGWLDWHRQTLLTKCAGLTADQLGRTTVEPSNLTLLGLVRHMTDVERMWFTVRATGAAADPIYNTEENPDGDLENIHDTDPQTVFDRFQAELAASDAAVADLPLDYDFATRHGPMSLRWVYLHLIEEYARHNGHADLIRERLDGVTGT